MEIKARQALLDSIAHWQDVVDDPVNTKTGPHDCALCEVFNNDFRGAGTECQGCPVMEKTGKSFCKGSPYGTFAGRRMDFGKNGIEGCFRVTVDDLRLAARNELEFLQDLLPEDEVYVTVETRTVMEEVVTRVPKSVPSTVHLSMSYEDAQALCFTLGSMSDCTARSSNRRVFHALEAMVEYPECYTLEGGGSTTVKLKDRVPA